MNYHSDSNDANDGNFSKSITFTRTCVPYYIHVYARSLRTVVLRVTEGLGDAIHGFTFCYGYLLIVMAVFLPSVHSMMRLIDSKMASSLSRMVSWLSDIDYIFLNV